MGKKVIPLNTFYTYHIKANPRTGNALLILETNAVNRVYQRDEVCRKLNIKNLHDLSGVALPGLPGISVLFDRSQGHYSQHTMATETPEGLMMLNGSLLFVSVHEDRKFYPLNAEELTAVQSRLDNHYQGTLLTEMDDDSFINNSLVLHA